MDKHMIIASTRITEDENKMLESYVEKLQHDNPDALIGKSTAMRSLIRAIGESKRKQSLQSKRSA